MPLPFLPFLHLQTRLLVCNFLRSSTTYYPHTGSCWFASVSVLRYLLPAATGFRWHWFCGLRVTYHCGAHFASVNVPATGTLTTRCGRIPATHYRFTPLLRWFRRCTRLPVRFFGDATTHLQFLPDCNRLPPFLSIACRAGFVRHLHTRMPTTVLFWFMPRNAPPACLLPAVDYKRCLPVPHSALGSALLHRRAPPPAATFTILPATATTTLPHRASPAAGYYPTIAKRNAAPNLPALAYWNATTAAIPPPQPASSSATPQDYVILLPVIPTRLPLRVCGSLRSACVLATPLRCAPALFCRYLYYPMITVLLRFLPHYLLPPAVHTWRRSLIRYLLPYPGVWDLPC